MCIILEFKKRSIETENSSDKKPNIGCEIVIFNGIRYSFEKNSLIDDKKMKSRKKMTAQKRPPRTKKSGG